MTDGDRFDVVVVGSANVDLSIPVPSIPAPGETVLGGEVLRGAGGKGANQAVAAARLGARVAMVGRVGDDGDAEFLRGRLAADGVDIERLCTTADVATGLAVIAVDVNAENSIVVASGANNRLSVADVEATVGLLASSRVVLTQLEVPLDVVHALRPLVSGPLILNPAPARPGVEIEGFDIVIPNEGELALLANTSPDTDLATMADQARSLAVGVVVVTLGARGAMVVFNDTPTSERGSLNRTGDGVVVVPAVEVEAVDTTAAGDSFCGAVAVALAEGAGVEPAVRWAIAVAARTVTARGAQDSLPRRTDVGSWHRSA